ncbi:ribosome small subunit-dependent GTPase A [Mycoplasma sp. Mirounga ES2805-ORL]|uniref:ribosome small subunit-dependent GTPase A n=1 Tax=Mycoplasma sp. Mirounga ES2805-ORL TaxID=754514 RepID=UPI00197C7611|nr:ribosome small subunit-dependent GTPase A [Mycoplasma sp. Mirounga ES2805-ORL]QSF13444.1 ribosome small subunit-dependent GTPase A [Mycoplasma sp. Mirounga ES2805-ORL]
MKGRIYSINSGIYHIRENNNDHNISAAGVFRHKDIVPLVGDFVEFEENKQITKILPRKNEFIRPRISNIDTIIVVMSIKEPTIKSILIDKYLSIVEEKNIKPIILLTKSDLGTTDLINQYKKMGYEIYEISYKTKDWVKNILEKLNGKTFALMGQSGVGKTTIINQITNLNLQTNTISKKANRGRHTTRIVQIYDIAGGHLIDTPGFSNIDLFMNKIEFSKSFAMFREISKQCKFKTCLHEKEPENLCAVKTAVKNNIIPKFRYDNYIKLLQECEKEWIKNT